MNCPGCRLIRPALMHRPKVHMRVGGDRSTRPCEASLDWISPSSAHMATWLIQNPHAYAWRLICTAVELVLDGDFLRGGRARGIGHLGGNRTNLRGASACGKLREQREGAARLRGAKILSKFRRGVNVDHALR